MVVYIIHLRLYECSPRFILQLHTANEEQEKYHLLVFCILVLIFFKVYMNFCTSSAANWPTG